MKISKEAIHAKPAILLCCNISERGVPVMVILLNRQICQVDGRSLEDPAPELTKAQA